MAQCEELNTTYPKIGYIIELSSTSIDQSVALRGVIDMNEQCK